MRAVIICWRTRGALIECGEAYRRDAGDEDEMPEAEARTLAATGVVEIVEAHVPPEIVAVEEDER